MADSLQKFDFRSSSYERPDKPWVCGYAAQGKPCQIGPDKRGHCRAKSECSPTKSGDRWNCSRSQFFGGPCKTGPNPDGSCCKPIATCQPVRSWRSKRGVVVRWATGLTLGLLLIVFAMPNSLSYLSPGELSRQHATLSQCSSCHASTNGGFSQWLSSVFGEYDHAKDNTQCQSCHDLGNNALAAHSLASVELASITVDEPTSALRSPNAWLASALYNESIKQGENIVCSSCHQEHLGADHDLTALSDGTCTICHESQFQSFNKGHPQFQNYPNNRRTHVNFDHVSHINKHFTEDDNREIAPQACLDCHVTQPGGGKMVVQNFEQTCANCHGSQIDGVDRASAKGIPIIGLPGIDVATLAERQVAIGEWPEFAEDDLTPYTRLLLSLTPGFNETIRSLADLDLLDLTEASDGQLVEVKNLVWMVKELIYDIEVRGTQAITDRISQIDEQGLDKLQERRLLAAMPPDLIEGARNNWFPSLLMEIQRYRSGEDVLSTLVVESDVSDDNESVDDDFGELFGEDDGENGDSDSEFDELFGESDESEEFSIEELEEEIGNDSEGDEFSIEELEEEMADDSNGDEFSIDGFDDEGDEFEISDLDSESMDEESGEIVFEDPRLPSEDRAGAGGWYRDEYQLRYRPTGHADPFIKAWMDIGAKNDTPILSKIFEELADSGSPGACMKCHSVDSAFNLTNINWQVRQSEPNMHEFNRFSHVAHFNLLDQDGCLTCHTFDNTSDYAGSFEDRNPLTFASNFKSISEQTCAQCHQPEKAGESCLTCHNYHIGDFKPAIVQEGGLSTEKQTTN